MPVIIFFLGFISFHAKSMNGILPPIFEASNEEQNTLCSEGKTQNPEFWKALMSHHIDDLIRSKNLNGLDKDVFKNLAVTLSYLEIYRDGPLRIRTMGYVYANASHHLGRLVRFSYWKKFGDFPLGKQDQALISGDILGSTLRVLPGPLARILMDHSLDLYKNLSWSLGAEKLCGSDYVLNMLGNNYPILTKAYTATTLTSFMKHFVEYEQTYLDETMYKAPAVKIPASMGVLDKMRFIPFNGEKQLSFFEWCRQTTCRKTSLNLKNRIKFDQLVIGDEILNFGQDMGERLKNSQIEEVADFILKNLESER